MMMRLVGADELKEWKAYYLLEPWGRGWQRDSMLAATLFNANGGLKDRMAEVDDFIIAAHVNPPRPPAIEREPQTVEEQIAIFDMIDAMAKGLDAEKAKQ